MFYDEKKCQCLSLIDFRCQSKWPKDKFSFEQFSSLFKFVPNLRFSSWILKCENSREEILRSTFVSIDHWRQLYSQLDQLYHFDCLVKCPLKSSNTFEIDLFKVIANVCRTNESFVDIQLFHQDQIEKTEVNR